MSSRLFFTIAAVLLGGHSLLAQTFESDVRPLLGKYCVECHSGDDANADIDFSKFATLGDVKITFQLWEQAEELVRLRKMPPEDAEQPSLQERLAFTDWYQQFTESIEARPGFFRPRRLSATEYRNTLRSLFGFDLEVAIVEAEQTIVEKSLVLKLLPTDPPGTSRFRNDTHSNPLSTQIWEQYAYLTDFALEELFSPRRRKQLAALGELAPGDAYTGENVESLVRNLLPRIYRRRVDRHTTNGVVQRITADGDLVAATKRELTAALMSPSFLYRGLLMPRQGAGRQLVDEFELAERLSYFIWADMPDDQLMELAANSELRKPDVLHTQVERMLDSPKAESLATDFAVQWLALDEIDQVSDNPPFMVALKSQPIDFMKYLFNEGRPLLELIDSDTTFMNPLTRRFYAADSDQLVRYKKPKGIEIEIVPNQKIKLVHTQGRGGLLTMPGVLAMNRGPILRGVWMLERILGEHLPDPPADVGQVEANIPGQDLSFRERFAQHREQESCAICHDKIDPFGFALEAYDASGAYRHADDYRKQKPRRQKELPNSIDTAGRLPTGEAFEDFDELKHLLITTQNEDIIRNIVKQLMAYALCRKLEIYDQPVITGIVNSMVAERGTYRDLVHAIVNSLPFQETIVSSQ